MPPTSPEQRSLTPTPRPAHSPPITITVVLHLLVRRARPRPIPSTSTAGQPQPQPPPPYQHPPHALHSPPAPATQSAAPPSSCSLQPRRHPRTRPSLLRLPLSLSSCLSSPNPCSDALLSPALPLPGAVIVSPPPTPLISPELCPRLYGWLGGRSSGPDS
ncbi:hypothetical protein LshimejAT787_2800140 [Lyophyllum shimeji]|uniref:Uncharacterized protein n=1 Tax=Lyophyllum shimeji TaxID=47721 RepID=A0A9P3Q231_LYOSH|nr:hypothetical protein LshimejAT787_2800140 [Lyophyllum shimeji]